jgi:hypothetical protein
MKKISFLVFSLMLCSVVLDAQTAIFKVMASSGKSTENAKLLKVGAALSANDKITIAPTGQTYLALSYSKGGTIQISKAGTYLIKDLEAKLLASKKSVSQKYADFVIGEMTKSGDVNIHKTPYKYQNVTGSVERSMFKSDLVAMLPTVSKFRAKEYRLAWHHVMGNKTYQLKIMNEFDEVVKTAEVQDTSFVLKTDTPELTESEMIKVFLDTKDVKLKYIVKTTLNRMESQFSEKMETQLAEIKKTFKEDVNGKLQEALLYEDNGLLLEAMQAYEAAMKAEPVSEIYTIAYNQFLIRNRIGPTEEQIRNQYK